MIEIADKVLVITESHKFGHRAFSRYASIEEVGVVATDSRISEHDKARLQDQGIRVEVAEQ